MAPGRDVLAFSVVFWYYFCLLVRPWADRVWVVLERELLAFSMELWYCLLVRPWAERVGAVLETDVLVVSMELWYCFCLLVWPWAYRAGLVLGRGVLAFLIKHWYGVLVRPWVERVRVVLGMFALVNLAATLPEVVPSQRWGVGYRHCCCRAVGADKRLGSLVWS